MLGIIILYVGLQVAIGVIVSRRVKTEDDYLLAGRRLGYPLVVFSIFATWFGAETCVGAAAEVYQNGLAGGSADPFGYALCILLMGLLFARTLWKRRLTTIADLYRERFSPGVERLAVLILVPGSLLWAAAQMRALGQVFSHASGLELQAAIGLAAAVAVTYTALGGLLADAITDVIQGAVLVVGLVALTWVSLQAAGGPVTALARVEPERWRIFGEDPGLYTLEAWAVPIVGSLVAQELIQRVLAARSPEVASRGAVAASGLYVTVGLLPVLMGLIGPQLYPNLEEPERLLPLLAGEQLPVALGGIFTAALVSAILSTVDTTLLVVSSLLAHNLGGSLLPRQSERQKLVLARIGVVGAGIAACFMALGAESVHSLVEEASAFGTAGIFVVFVFGVTTRFGSSASAYAALAAGVSIWICASYLFEAETPFLLSLSGALLAYVVVALAVWMLRPGPLEARRNAPPARADAEP